MTANRYDEGLAVRREVVGDSYVEQAAARTTDFTRDFQRIVTEFAWGTIWTRPGLDRRSHSMITLTALIARGHHEEFALHIRAGVSSTILITSEHAPAESPKNKRDVPADGLVDRSPARGALPPQPGTNSPSIAAYSVCRPITES